MNKERIEEIKNLLKLVPKGPWEFSEGDDFDHWQLYSPIDAVYMVQDDAGVSPDRDFITFLLKARSVIEELLIEVEIKNE